MPGDLQQELLGLFGQEAETRLAQLSENLLELEEHGGDDELIGSLFRDAHTLKGSAAVVGLAGFSSVAHGMEDLLGQLRQGERVPTPELVDGLLVAVDGLRRLLPALLSGADVSADTGALARQLAASVPGRPGTALARPSPPAPRTDSDEPAHHGPASRQATGTSVRVPLARLDEMAALVGESAAAHLRLGQLLQQRLGPAAADLAEVHDLGRTLNSLQETTMRARMVPIAAVAEPLRRAARDVARIEGKDVRWVMTGEDTEIDRSVLDGLSEALLHLVRNAVDHGVERPEVRASRGKPLTATVALDARQVGAEVVVTVSDDGGGVDLEELRRRAGSGADLDEADTLRLLFRAGFSTASEVTDISGRGVGLDVVKVAVEALRGRVEVRSVLGVGSEFKLVVPITLAVLRCLLAEAGGQPFAIPMHSVVTVLAAGEGATRARGREAVLVRGDPIPVSDLAETLELPQPRPERPPPGVSASGVSASGGSASGAVVVLVGLNRRFAFRVDRVLRHREVVVKSLSPLLPRVDVLAGASIEPDGSVLYVLDGSGLIDRARRFAVRTDRPDSGRPAAAAPSAPPTVLVVDDTAAVRTVQRTILERAGYRVIMAADGIEALAALRTAAVEVVVTDIEMPRMDGIELTRAIRADPRLAQTGIIMLTARGSDEDRRAGLEAGADAYMPKRAFDQSDLLNLVGRMLGPSERDVR